MCGRYQLEIPSKTVFLERFELSGEDLDEPESSWNIAPSQIQPVILANSPNRLKKMSWGLVPFWDKTDRPKKLINLRDDTLINKKWGHRYLQEQRCLVPATGFYEWKVTKEGKQPYSFSLKSGEIFAMAGIYSVWKNPEKNEEEHTYGIITTTPNEMMSRIHNRMPVILEKTDEARWLNHDLHEIEQIQKFLQPFCDDQMQVSMVSKRVNNPLENDKMLLQKEHTSY